MPFFPSCSEVNSTGYSEFDEPIDQCTRLTLSTVLVYTKFKWLPLHKQKLATIETWNCTVTVTLWLSNATSDIVFYTVIAIIVKANNKPENARMQLFWDQ